MTSRAAALVAAAAIATGMAACGHGAARSPGGKPTPPGKAQVIVAPAAFKRGGVALSTWLAYGSGKIEAYDRAALPPANDSGDDFQLELAGREAQSAFWAEHRKDADARPDADLDRQVDIWRAGFLAEMVIAVHGRPGWTVPAATVGSLRFEEFAERFKGDFKQGAPVAVKPASGKLYPDVPGDDFPDPESLPVGPATCGVARAQRAAAWRRWDALAPRLGGTPVGASSTLDFARQLIALKRDPDRAPRAVTWVSERVAHLAMVEGFCAVEEHDWPRALITLARAIALAPASPRPRLELAGALSSAGRNKEALKEADHVLASAYDDGCVIARAWRRRGYILVELNALTAARAAYVKSLDVDPGNRIALAEIATIDAAIKRGKGVKDIPELTVPLGSVTVVTTCKPTASK